MRLFAALIFAAAFDPQPWLADLAQAKAAFATRYANLEWAQLDSDTPLSTLIDRTRARILSASSDADARAALDRLARTLGDGHVRFSWPHKEDAGSRDPCSSYHESDAAAPVAALAKGYVPLGPPGLFPAGTIVAGGKRVGVIQIGLFGPHAAPALCQAALAALRIARRGVCDDACAERIDAWASDKYTEAFIARIEALRTSDVLLIDVAGNGGGSEWAEAAARMLTPVRLRSARGGFVRGEHWTKKMAALEQKLRGWAAKSSGDDLRLLEGLAAQAAEKRAQAATPCDPAPLWRGSRLADCTWLVEGLDIGALALMDPATLRGKPWAAELYAPLEFPSFREGVWRGPLVVLVDHNTASAAEEFAALIQENHAGVVMGAPTYGAGCGYTDGGTPTTLSHSKAKLLVPDCARFEADGSNAVRGLQPDVLVGFRTSDAGRLRAAAFLERLPEALQHLNR